MEKVKMIERSIITTYRKPIWSNFIKAIKEFSMINENDKIAVCISGGKDSMLLAKCIQELHKHSDVKFDVEYIVMNPGYNEKNLQKIMENAETLQIPIKIFKSDIFDIVVNEENPCYLCARMRRGYLYKFAQSLGCNKIALGHHFDDAIETLLLSIFYGSQIQGMLPKLKSTNHPPMELIRPLYFIKEKDIINWSKHNCLSFLQCACKFTSDTLLSKEDASKRKEIKKLIQEMKKKYENIDVNILRSTYNVNLDTLIGYKKDNKKHLFSDDY